MLNINFVPDDYIQGSESHRTNLFYLVLFLIVMVGLAGSFAAIKVRQKELKEQEKLVNTKVVQAQENMKKFDEVQSTLKTMLKTAVTASDLIETVPRSILVASLTNNLPAGTSLLKINCLQKEINAVKSRPKAQPAPPANKYQLAKAEKGEQAQPEVSPERLLETQIEIEGIAPSDLQVASYIERLGGLALLDDVELVESKEYKNLSSGTSKANEDSGFRQFKLTAIVRKDAHVTIKDLERIKVENLSANLK